MALAVELFLDHPSTRAVERIWRSLDRTGIPSLGADRKSSYRPHVSLAVVDDADETAVMEGLRTLAPEAIGLRLALAGIGFFLTEESPAFLTIVPTTQLLAIHRRVISALEPVCDTMWPHYRTDAWLPHCTLALQVTDRGRAADVVALSAVPASLRADAVGLVRVPGGEVRALLAKR